MVGDAAAYPWSSAAAHVSGVDKAQLLSSTTLQAGGGCAGWASRLRNAFSGEQASLLRSATQSGVPFASAEVIEKLQRECVQEATTALRGMIVDSDSQSRLAYANLFSQRGVRCALAGDLSTTQSIVKWAHSSNRPFDFLLLDSQVPGIEGAQNTFGSDIGETPVIFISDLARNDNESAAEAWSPPSSWTVLPRTFSHSELWDVMLSAVSRLRPDVEYVESPQQSVVAKAKKVLLVEDVAAMQLVTLGMLERQPLDVTVVSNGKEALERLAVESFDAVLMDLQMPVMGGLEATELIRHREKESGTHTPVIGLTAHAMEGTKKTCLAAGMDDFLTKPISPERLVSALEAVLDESH